MNRFPMYLVVVALSLTTPISFAGSDRPLTRQQVKADLAQLEAAGYRPGANDLISYPDQLQSAEARVAFCKHKEGKSAPSKDCLGH